MDKKKGRTLSYPFINQPKSKLLNNPKLPTSETKPDN